MSEAKEAVLSVENTQGVVAMKNVEIVSGLMFFMGICTGTVLLGGHLFSALAMALATAMIFPYFFKAPAK